MRVSLALGIRLQRDEDQCLVRGAAAEAETGDGENPFHFRNILKNGLNLLADALGVLERRARRRLHRDDEIALVFIGHETLGHALENQIAKPQSAEEHQRCDELETQDQAQGPPVSLGDAVNGSVHSLEEPVLFAVLAAQQDGGQRGRKGQRVEGGNRNRERDGQRELAKQNAGGAGKNATGTNTATSTSEVAMTAPATSDMATDAALWVSLSPS